MGHEYQIPDVDQTISGHVSTIHLQGSWIITLIKNDGNQADDILHIYKPIGIPMKQLETTDIEPDEFEALRLCDLEDKHQEEAGEIMGISRGTVQRLLYSGRRKIVSALLNNFAIKLNNMEE